MTAGLSGLRPTEAEIVRLAGRDVPVRWRRSSRARRLSLRIDAREAEIVITLPPRAEREAGMALLRNHAVWALSRLDHLPAAAPWHDGGQVVLDGCAHGIVHCPDGRRGVWIEDGVVKVSGEAPFLRRRLATFLRQEAGHRLGERLTALTGSSGLRPRRLVIKDTSSRWGSCSANGTVMLNWRLVMAPVDVQHYVIAHELAHLRHMNHGSDFWVLVAALTPHRHMAETWLRRHGPALLRAA
ncbi:M48 family metallopeptidase [Gluconacetobacter sp. 1b LMG 1731]|uniref:M48 family metallopeptidase n=1 Tax=Gluconacetobacter dulcium TaxID=2729096 RepID=A0A7W4NU78_9PROT|nr:SprT family zinc-dependent metalloprotease [Gluconacetobacter dulcium]MBB2166317.1 M48 family metallopeptidase [Gluconacetobacter dulcium]MBB2195423.1 M48 family metallopeptidase [Gluconacetobacter dulcium]